MSWIHVDANGASTMIQVQVGQKYWMLGTPKYSSHQLNYYEDFDINGANIHKFDWEGWLLNPGDTL